MKLGQLLTRKPTDLPKLYTLDELWVEAETFGTVWLWKCSPRGGYFSKIEFITKAYHSLEAKSDHGAESPQAALLQAIERAKEIQSTFK